MGPGAALILMGRVGGFLGAAFEGSAAAAAASGVRVLDTEPCACQVVAVIDAGSGKERKRLRIHHDPHVVV